MVGKLSVGKSVSGGGVCVCWVCWVLGDVLMMYSINNAHFAYSHHEIDNDQL